MFVAASLSLMVFSVGAAAAPYAAIVLDARTGEVLHARNADTRLHPAGLTKLMTLYIAFHKAEAGEISLDDYVYITRNAASERPVKLGALAGQKIKLRYLIRAAGVQGANDAATAIGEAIAGSEEEFVKLSNQFAAALGMENTNLHNAHGLTTGGHLSTARDMTILTLALRRDFPEYWNLFERRSADAGIKTVNHSGRRLLDAYEGVEAVKTGYTRAAGFNGMAVATRDHKTVSVVVFGGKSEATRNARMTELLDMGFERAQDTLEAGNLKQVLQECIANSTDAKHCAGELAAEYCGATTATCLESEVIVWKSLIPDRLHNRVAEALADCVLKKETFSPTASQYCKIFAVAEHVNHIGEN